jgi:DNA-binding PadR family transcriptional regulator
MLRYVLLGLMAECGPSHGYALRKAFAARSGVRLSIGNVYRELRRLREERLIVAVPNPTGADPRRAPYDITDAGRSELRAWLTKPAHTFLRDPVDPISYRLALLGNGDVEHALSFLEELRTELALQRRAAEREGPAAGTLSPFLLRRRTKHLAADMELLEEMRDGITSVLGKTAAKPTGRTARPGPVQHGGRGKHATASRRG